MKLASKLSLPIAALAVSTALASSASAAVNFAFDYSDPSNGSLWTPDRVASLERAAGVVSSLFTNYTASIEIEIKAENNAGSTTLASAGSNDFVPAYTPGFSNSGVVMNEILTGTDANGASFDGTVNVNWAQPFSTAANAADVPGDQFDFDSTMTHELLHAVGFLSSIQMNGTDPFGNSNAGDWNPFDQYIANSSGLLINQTTFDMNSGAYASSVVGGAGIAGLSFNGPLAMAANGGDPIYIYTPSTGYEEGSSGTHIDDQFPAYNLIMEASTDFGPGVRGISAVERAILMDIGYTQLTPVPEPSAGLLAGLAASVCLLRRRRK